MATAPEVSAFSQLSFQRKRFVALLVADPNMNATQAAIGARYSVATAAQSASRLLRTVKVRKAISELLKDATPSTEEIAARWDRVSRASLDDFHTVEEYEEATTEQRPLIERIAELEYEIDFEQRVVDRQNLDAEQLLTHQRRQQGRRNQIIRLEVELEMNPAATYKVDGPPAKKTRLVLNLVKAQAAGVLDLAKAIKPTANGTAIELRDPDAALDKLARMAGAYEKDNAQTRPQVAIIEVVAPPARQKGGAGE